MKKVFLSLLLLLSVPSSAVAQTVVEAELDTASILIGEQVQLRLSVKTDSVRRVDFPTYAAEEEITQGVEVIANGAVDTTRHNDGRRVELVRLYTVTSFDSALYNILPYVLLDGDTMRARAAVGLKVNTVPVDTVHVDQFPGPHGVVEGTFTWSSRILWLCLLLWLCLGGLVALCVRLSDRKPVTRRVVIPPKVAPHKQAMAAMENIRTLPTDGREEAKAYYMRLTDVLRTYIEERFGFNAKEMTSQEIIASLLQRNDPTLLRELREVFGTADLVKFAKYEAAIGEADRSLLQAMDFVNTTKPDEAELPKATVQVVTLGDTKQRALRSRMRFAAIALAAASAVLYVYIIWEIITTFL
ncbi:MAG: hypothetical protein IJ729_02235 [Alloprevotella sp.]|nr:hypothetical protein [Alloprevotella sp.]